MAKNIRKLIIEQETVIIEFNDGRQIQFCKRCTEQGKHMQDFIRYFVPRLQAANFKRQSLTFLEQQYFYRFAHKRVPRFMKRELHELAAVLDERVMRI